MPIKKSDITHLQSVAFVQLPKNRDEMRQVIELFKSRKIETLREAQKTIEYLGSKGKKSYNQVTLSVAKSDQALLSPCL